MHDIFALEDFTQNANTHEPQPWQYNLRGRKQTKTQLLSHRDSGTSLNLSEGLLSNTIGDFKKVMLGDPGMRTVELLLLSVRLSMLLCDVCSAFRSPSELSRTRHHASAMRLASTPSLHRSAVLLHSSFSTFQTQEES